MPLRLSIPPRPSAESVGNSSFDENSSTTPVPIGQQKATAILPEVHPVTGELDTTTVSVVSQCAR